MTPTIRERVIAQAKKTALLRHRLIVNRKAGKHPRVLAKAYHRAKAELVKRRHALAIARDPRARAVKLAASYIGTKEYPAGSNWGPVVSRFLKRWGLGPNPWCGAFAGYILSRVGVLITGRVVYVPNIAADAKNATNGFRGWTTDWHRAQPGDLVSLFGQEHVEMVVKVARTGLKTIGGNTSFDNASSQSNGGCVAPKFRTPSQIDGIALVRFPK